MNNVAKLDAELRVETCNMETPDKPKQRKRRWQFSLRVLLIFATVIGMGFGWVGWKLERARRTAKLIQIITNSGNSCSQSSGNVPSLNIDTGVRAMYRRCLLTCTNFDPYRSVHLVHLDFKNGKQRSLVEHILPFLSEFDSLSNLSLVGAYLDDKTLRAIPDLPCLEELCCYDCEVGENGLNDLQRFGGLRKLSLHNTSVIDSRFAGIPALPLLESLYLGGSPITDSAIPTIVRQCPRLQSLGLSDTAVTDAGLANLKGLNELRILSLPAATSDVGLRSIAGLPAISSLSCAFGNTVPQIYAPQITDVGLGELRRLKRLERLFLGKTSVTAEGFSQLRHLEEFRHFYLISQEPFDFPALEKILPNVNAKRF